MCNFPKNNRMAFTRFFHRTAECLYATSEGRKLKQESSSKSWQLLHKCCSVWGCISTRSLCHRNCSSKLGWFTSRHKTERTLFCMPNAGTNGHYMQEIFMTQELCSVALHFLYCKDKLVRWWWPYAMIWQKELWSWVRDPAFLAHPVVLHVLRSSATSASQLSQQTSAYKIHLFFFLRKGQVPPQTAPH